MTLFFTLLFFLNSPSYNILTGFPGSAALATADIGLSFSLFFFHYDFEHSLDGSQGTPAHRNSHEDGENKWLPSKRCHGELPCVPSPGWKQPAQAMLLVLLAAPAGQVAGDNVGIYAANKTRLFLCNLSYCHCVFLSNARDFLPSGHVFSNLFPSALPLWVWQEAAEAADGGV